jgi:hypothetical protein
LSCLLPWQGRPFKRATTWNKYLDSISDTKLQELGLTREVLELTRYSRDHLQHEVEGSYDDLPISSIASAVLNWAPGYQALFKFMYGQDPGEAVGQPVVHHQRLHLQKLVCDTVHRRLLRQMWPDMLCIICQVLTNLL